MNNDIKFSVIINCYNGEKYLRETIDSVIAQTYTNWELIVWDNQSTDKTRSITESYDDNRIRYYYASSHTPLGEARSCALQKVQGDIIGFLDSDDVWKPNCLEIYMSYFTKFQNVGLAYSRFYSKTERGGWTSEGADRSRIVKTEELVDKYNIGMSCAFFKSAIIVKNSIYFNRAFSLIEDYDFFLRVSSCTQTLYIPEVLMEYRVYDGNSTSKGDFAAEYDIFAELIENDSRYLNLVPYLNVIKRGSNRYKIIQSIRDGHNSRAFCLIVRSLKHDFYCSKYLITMLIGKNMSKLYRRFIEKFK